VSPFWGFFLFFPPGGFFPPWGCVWGVFFFGFGLLFGWGGFFVVGGFLFFFGGVFFSVHFFVPPPNLVVIPPTQREHPLSFFSL